jgi:Holliday junction resolvase
MSAGARGSNRERAVAERLRADGWIVYRSAGSHGNADLVAMKVGFPPLLVQVKSSRRPFEHFRPEERRALEEEALLAGAVPWLVHWPTRGKETWVSRFEWPGNDELRAAYTEDGAYELDDRIGGRST